ncbi:MAG: hypothetical protein A2722_02935 [Candidatus Doudnabacteria bacterium RIFCSPHIGHO2_01_FULL_50_11]|uniref:Flippase-like domain-containing protein n=1 Tax=Candidatus Doudnabacteria bacterium RIFCSPHIGHO2_01_FULL_50_11 TaxID=1817828 RepID=A0A1F5PI34_9BACT|nr:MAG: hypothetical protein A2722_02935 [Candidatus Doudnabacteria bacterium RIFCSPHIGHO2_01_FULL_50_11]
MKIDFRKTFFGLIIAGLISYVLLRQVHPGDVAHAFGALDRNYLMAALLILLMMNGLKAWRFSALLFGELSFRDLVPIVFLHNLFISFMPSRTGEVSYLYLLKKRFNVGVGQSLASLMIARVLDVLVILLLIFGTLLFAFPGQLAPVRKFLPLIVLGVIGLIVAFYVLLFQAEFLYNLLDKWFANIRLYDKRFIGSLARKGVEILGAFTRRYTHLALLRIAVVTVAIWLLTFGFEFMLFRGLGLQISYWQFLIASFFPVLTHIIPVQSFGGIGTYEATITGGFVLLGFDAGRVIPMTFAVHLVQLALTAIFGLLGYWFYRTAKIQAKI